MRRRAKEYRQAEITRRRKVVASTHLEDPFAQDLAAAADQYIVSRGDQKTVIAGYHWFSDWGRDTMIALPGLTLPTGKHDVAQEHPANFRQACRSRHAAQPFPRCRRDARIQHGRCHALVL